MNMTSQAQTLPPTGLEATVEFNHYPTQSNRGGPTVKSWLGPVASFEPETFVNEVFDRQPLENIAWSDVEDPSKYREQVNNLGAPYEANAHWNTLPLPGPYPYLDSQEEYSAVSAMLDTQGDPFQLQYPADVFETESISSIAGPSQPPLGGPQETVFDPIAQSQHSQLHYYDDMGSQDQRYVAPSDINSAGQYISNNFQMGDTGDLGYVNLSGEQVDRAFQEPGIARAQRKRSIADVDHDMSSMQYTKPDGRANKRRCNSSGSSSHPSARDNFEESEPEEDDDSDVYQPSRSPSPRAANSRNSNRSRRANISAALALKAFGDQEGQGALSDDGSVIITRRSNRSIPLPVPVPNLTKKSRGRKVPSLGMLRTSGSEDEGSVGPSHGRDERSYVCSVAGCGKCFFRGEHLKRHVRSIHTFEKPHVCPYEGCHKSFSRRDNLGQHLRIHL